MQPLEVMAQEFQAYKNGGGTRISKTLLAAGAVLVLVIFALSGQSPSSGSANTFQPGPPIAALAPPGECAFGEDWSPAPLVDRKKVSDDAVLLRFGLADGRSLGLSTCACLLAQGAGVVRPYTPVSTNALSGAFELLVKVYPEGALSKHLATIPIGSSVNFKHIPKNVKIQYPFPATRIGMIAGGSGVTPFVQALHAILGTPEDKTEVTLLASHRTRADALAVEAFDAWAAASKGRLRAITTLTREPASSAWAGRRGRLDARTLKAFLPPPVPDVLIFVCGPPAMYESLCGPRDDPELTGILRDLGYSKDQVIKF